MFSYLSFAFLWPLSALETSAQGFSSSIGNCGIHLVVSASTAGLPILANENVEDIFPIPLDYVSHNKELFMLNISGDSMINAGIFDGDLAIIEECKTANNGEIVVALIENEATIKRFYKEKNNIRLQPENDNMEAIIVDDCKILGKLVGLFRTY